MDHLNQFLSQPGKVEIEARGPLPLIARCAVSAVVLAASFMPLQAFANDGSHADPILKGVHDQVVTIKTVKGAPGLFATNDVDGCTVVVSGGNALSSWLAQQTGIQDKKLAQDFALHHERSHCDLIRNQDISFNFSELSGVTQEQVNKLLRRAPNHPFSKLFAENYADTAAAMAVLRQTGYSKQSVHGIESLIAKRESIERSAFGKTKDIPHQTSRALKLVLENIDELRQLEDSTAFIEMATRIASESAMRVAAASPLRFEVDEGAASVDSMEMLGVQDTPGKMGLMKVAQVLDVATLMVDEDRQLVEDVAKATLSHPSQDPDKLESMVRKELRSYCMKTSMEAARQRTDAWRETRSNKPNP